MGETTEVKQGEAFEDLNSAGNSPEKQKSLQEKENAPKTPWPERFKEWFMPWKTETQVPEVPCWLKLLCTIALVLLLNQIKFPVLGGKIALGDIAFLVAFIPVFYTSLIRKRFFFFPLTILLPVVAVLVANAFACPGIGGAVECAQLILQLVCGVILMGFMVETMPGGTIAALFYALILNLGMAYYQGTSMGFDSILAPADVLKRSWGIGGAYTGLFRSRMAISFFLGTAATWMSVICLGKKGGLFKTLAGIVVLTFTLLGIVHGQIFLLTAFVLALGGFLISRRAGIATLVAIALSLGISLTCLPSSHFATLQKTLNPMKLQYQGELKTHHIDYLAALKMAERVPWCGVGSGRYQQNIGQCYGELPNPTYNDIDTDTQAGWGILAGTVGWPATLLLLLFLLATAGSGIRRYWSSQAVNTLALAGGLSLLVFIGGMFLSDPLTRGLGWMLALAIASVAVPSPEERISLLGRLAPATFISIMLIFCVMLGGIAMRPVIENPLARRVVETAQPVRDGGTVAPVTVDNGIFKIVDAADVISFTPPVEKGTDSQAAKNAVLVIPDEKGKPAEGCEPDMKFGGATFNVTLPKEANCCIWLRVWWSGSCGNTINVRLDQEERSHTAGNDGEYEKWHWVSVPNIFKMSQGEHVITLLNREDGIKFDQMLITDDTKYVPQGIEEE